MVVAKCYVMLCEFSGGSQECVYLYHFKSGRSDSTVDILLTDQFILTIR